VKEDNRSMCRSGEGFLKLPSVKLPDTSKAVVNTSMTVKECEEACLRNCSCMAYTSADDSRGGSGCIALYGELLDTRLYPSGGQDVYYRADAVALGIASFNIALPFKTYMLRHSHIMQDYVLAVNIDPHFY